MARRRSKLSNIILYVLIAILACGLIGVSVKLNNSVSTKTVSAVSFTKGCIGSDGLLSTEGEQYSAVSPFVNVDGLKVEIEEDDVKFKIHYYDENNDHIEASVMYTENFDSSSDNTVPSSASKARIELYLTSGEPISQLSVGLYASHLIITYNK